MQAQLAVMNPPGCSNSLDGRTTDYLAQQESVQVIKLVYPEAGSTRACRVTILALRRAYARERECEGVELPKASTLGADDTS